MNRVLLIQALNALQAGATQEAAWRLQAILDKNPQHAEAQYYMGVVAHRQQNHEEALIAIEKALALAPQNGLFYYGKGAVFQSTNRVDEAISNYRQALALLPELEDARFNLAVLLQQQNQLVEAESHYQILLKNKSTLQTILKNQPAHQLILRNLGHLASSRGQPGEAISYYRQALVIDPKFAEVSNNLGVLLQEQGLGEEAIEAYRQGIQAQPDLPQLHNNLGNAFKTLGRLEEAKACYEEAIRLQPDYASPYRNLGILYRDMKQTALSVQALQKAVSLNPNMPEAYIDLGDVLLMRNQMEEAIAAYETALQLEPKAAVQIKLARALPRIYQSPEDVAVWRERFSRQFQAVCEQPVQLNDPVSEIGSANFYLAYQGLDDRPLQEQIGRMFQQAYPWKQVAHIRNVKPRIGFFSTYFKPGHTITKLYAGLLEQLSRQSFEIFIYTHRLLQELPIQAAHEIQNFETDKLPPMMAAIAQDELDVLFYPDIGMEPISYFLAFNRLAPVQCVGWGHPDTTGIPSVDYFVSSKLLEPENAQQFYTENLVLLDTLPTFYQRPTLGGNPLSRTDFGLSEHEHLYVCPQTLFKFHPEFDAMLADILRQDPQGRLVLVNSHLPEWGELLLKRFQANIPDVADRIRMLPALSHQAFLNLVALADVVLDTLHFGGGNTTYETLAFGTPIVTLPQTFMRSRVTTACYRKMDITDGIAASRAEYVEKAVRLGTEPDVRNELKARILQQNHLLFEDVEAVRQLERFFLEAIESAPRP